MLPQKGVITEYVRREFPFDKQKWNLSEELSVVSQEVSVMTEFNKDRLIFTGKLSVYIPMKRLNWNILVLINRDN